MTIQVGRPVAVASADARRDQAVDSVGAAIAQKPDIGRVVPGGRPPGRESASRRRCRRDHRRGRCGPSARMPDSRLREAAELLRDRVGDRRGRRVVGGTPVHSDHSASVAMGEPVAIALARPFGSTRIDDVRPSAWARSSRSSHRRPAAGGPARPQATAASALLVGMSPNRGYELGLERRGAQAGRSRRRCHTTGDPIVRAEPELRRRLGEDRVAGTRRRARLSGSASPGSSWRPHTMKPRGSRPHWPAITSSSASLGCGAPGPGTAVSGSLALDLAGRARRSL